MASHAVMLCANAAVIQASEAARPCISSAPLRGQRVRFKVSVTHQPCCNRRAVFVRSAVETVDQLSDFAQQEERKFREGVLKELAKNESSTAEMKDKSVDICARIFAKYVERYDGTFSPEPFTEMKRALDAEGLEGRATVLAAIGWARYYLYHDWKVFKGERK